MSWDNFYNDNKITEYMSKRKFLDTNNIINTLGKDCFKKVNKILDQGCGYGRISKVLELLGKEVYGVDIHKKSIENIRSLSKNPERYFIGDGSKDIKELENLRFDLIVNYWSCFGHLKTKKENFNLVEKAYGLLDFGGFFILETIDKEFIVSNFKELMIDKESGIKRFSTLNKDKSVLSQKWVVGGGDYTTNVLIFSDKEIIGSFVKNGFKIESIQKKNGRILVLGKKAS